MGGAYLNDIFVYFALAYEFHAYMFFIFFHILHNMQMHSYFCILDMLIRPLHIMHVDVYCLHVIVYFDLHILGYFSCAHLSKYCIYWNIYSYFKNAYLPIFSFAYLCILFAYMNNCTFSIFVYGIFWYTLACNAHVLHILICIFLHITCNLAYFLHIWLCRLYIYVCMCILDFQV